MHRSVVAGVGAAAIVAAVAWGWMVSRQAREFGRLLAVGDAALAEGRTVEAVESFSGAVALNPGSMVAFLKRGDAHRRAGQLAAALRDLNRARTLDRTAPKPIELLGDVNLAMARDGEAADHYREFLALDERSAGVFHKLGVATYRSAGAMAAVEPLSRALALDPRLAEAHAALGLVQRDLGRPRQAAASLARAIELDPTLAAARLALVAIEPGGRRTPAHLRTLADVSASDADGASRLVRVASAYASHGRLDEAVRLLRLGAQRYPDDRSVPVALGRVWLSGAAAGRDPAALRRARAILAPAAAQPGATGDALAAYGRALLLDGRPAEAERILREAVDRLPVPVQAFVDLAAAAEALGHRDTMRLARARHAALASP